MGQIIISSGDFIIDMSDTYGGIWSSARDMSADIDAKIDVADTSGNHAISYGKQADNAVSFTDLITGDNSTFASDTGWWGMNSDISIAGGVCQFLTTPYGNALYKGGLLTIGRATKFTTTIINRSSGRVRIEASLAYGSYLDSNGVHVDNITPTGTALYVTSRTAGTTLDVDTITAQQYDSLGTDAIQVKKSGGARGWDSIDGGFKPNSIATVTITFYPEIVGNEKPDDGVTRAISADTTAMRLMIDVADDSGLDLPVRFYSMPGNTLLGTDTVTGGTGTAEYLWTGRSLDTAYQWKAVADDGTETDTSDTFTFTTRATAFTIFSYIAGTARKFPTAYNLRILGADYHTILAWDTDRVLSKDLVTAVNGEGLGIPTGLAHTETTTGNGISIVAGTDSVLYFPFIFGENPASKPSLQITNNTPAGSELSAFTLNGYSDIFDVAAGLTSTHDLSGGVTADIFHLESTAHAKLIGCTNNNIFLPNISGSPLYIFIITNNGDGGVIECAYDQSKTISVGTGLLLGVAAGNHNPSYIYNSVFNDMVAGIVNVGTNLITVKNVCSQGSTGGVGNFYDLGGGGFAYTTCADEQGLTFAADGYMLAVSDAQGTDLSADGVFAFTDDINGVAWGATWDRAVNYIAPSGWTGTILGVSGANLSKFNGVPRANIDKINGV